MSKVIITDATETDYADILRLNEEFVHFLSPLTYESLSALAFSSEMVMVAKIDDKLAGFCIVVREKSDYASVNYRWFCDHFDHFLYVDRVVVAGDCRRFGVGRAFYDFIFDYARNAAVERVTAEIDILPENPVSLAFHAGFGFKEVGKQMVCGGTKQVSLQEAPIK